MKKLGLVGAAWNLGQKKLGVEKGPQMLRQNNLLQKLQALGYQTRDYGDVSQDNQKNNKHSILNKQLYEKVFQSHNENDITLVLGGDHSCGTGSVYGTFQKYKQDMKVLWIDAHADINTMNTSPSGNYHGMPVSHLLGLDNMNSLEGYEWKRENISPENIIFLGIRDLDQGEKDLLKKHNIKGFSPEQIQEEGGIENTMRKIAKLLELDKSNTKLHVSFDIDACCGSYMTGTGTPVDKGLTKEQSQYIMNFLNQSNKMIHLDLVELNTDLEKGSDKTLQESTKLIEYGFGKKQIIL